LIKDNHIIASGGIGAAFKALKEKFPGKPIEIEVDSLEQLTQAIAAGAQLVLLDNMNPELCKKAVALVAGKCKLEASGGITLENAKAFADTGVDYLAIGALTHSAPALDIALDFRKGK
jgi:nicotinate-nucleotide pyrophosphorylase (carboxylating)